MLRLYIREKGQYGLGECFFWEHKTDVEELKHSFPVLRKLKFKENNISLSDVIEWKDLKIKGFGVKPPAVSFKYKISWRKFCILLIEIGFRILGVDPDVHVQGPTAKDNRSNPIDYDSADDFEPPKQLPKTSQVGIVTLIFKSVKSLSDIKGKISLQICDVLPSNANNVNCVINVSDTQFWIPITLDKGFFEKVYIFIG